MKVLNVCLLGKSCMWLCWPLISFTLFQEDGSVSYVQRIHTSSFNCNQIWFLICFQKMQILPERERQQMFLFFFTKNHPWLNLKEKRWKPSICNWIFKICTTLRMKFVRNSWLLNKWGGLIRLWWKIFILIIDEIIDYPCFWNLIQTQNWPEWIQAELEKCIWESQ